MLQAGELDGEAVFQMAHPRPCTLPSVTNAPIGGR